MFVCPWISRPLNLTLDSYWPFQVLQGKWSLGTRQTFLIELIITNLLETELDNIGLHKGRFSMNYSQFF